ncbi:MAG TPA: hypothetical protein IGS53_24050 [Leptolyngbyaceae cyanobacterium M33_DOE_097]|uniref:Uncharacterized protein n=1 Tax=Oscillatoriales cyanobacterium SpSt-418 TaxID=2282169 RepID=A0A7C3KGX9_9CYAN|nr:hypothetical protein [Leptolyngbyaceae cyanobacterium M33_DOE_097]
MSISYDVTQSNRPFVRAIHTPVKGRAWYHVAGLQRSTPLKHYLETRLLARDGIRRVLANPVTGNILVHFDAAKGDVGDRSTH